MENEEKGAFKGDYLLHLLYGDTLSVYHIGHSEGNYCITLSYQLLLIPSLQMRELKLREGTKVVSPKSHS